MKNLSIRFTILSIYLLLLCFQAVNSHERIRSQHHNCVHDKIMSQFKPQEYEIPQDQMRVLQTQNASNIRITTEYFNLQAYLSNSQFNLQLAQYLQQVTDVAVQFFRDTIKILPLTSIIKLSAGASCLGYTIPTNDTIFTSGISSSDYHLYITITDEPSSSFVAYAGTCYFRSGNRKIPVIGRVNFNYYYIKKVNLNDPQQFEDTLETVIHEFTHAFGFSGWLIQNNYWYNKATQTSFNASDILQPNVTIRGILTHLLKSPNVLNLSRTYYNCPTMQGMQLENQGGDGSLGSHWERTILNNEIMTASVIGTDAAFSLFTIALLKDTGFYESIREDVYDSIIWGKGKGCSFVNNACNETQQTFPEFCTDAQVSSQYESCNYEQSGSGRCLGGDTFGDNCPYVRPYYNTYCLNSTNPKIKNYTQFGLNSKCFASSILPAGWSGGYQFDCFAAECIESGSKINITVGIQNYICTQPNQVLPAQSGHSGSITCPQDFSTFCTPLLNCPGFCSYNGYCLNKQCYCNDVTAGEDCSVQCNGVLENNTCVQSCSPGFYLKLPSWVCYPCNQACQNCTGPNSNQCLSCKSGGYLNGTECMSSCSPPLFGNPLNYTCGTTCPTNYYKDSNQNLCVQQCSSGTFANNNTFSCEGSCPTNQYKLISQGRCVADCKPENLTADPVSQSCVTSCPAQYYNDSIISKCTQNCSSNQFGNTLTYECLAKCPSTLYSNQEQYNNTCLQACPSPLKTYELLKLCYPDCAVDQFYNISSNQCTAQCQGNFYGDTPSKICLPDCPPGYLGDKSTNKCVVNCPGTTFTNEENRTCELSCSAFTIVSNRTCVNQCPSSLYALYSLKQCLDTCPAGYFVDTPSNNCTLKCTTAGYLGNPVTQSCGATCPDYYFKDANISQCTQNCSGIQFGDTLDLTCKAKCPSTLYTYRQLMNNTCVQSCPSNLNSDNNLMICYQSCPTGQFFDLLSQNCVQVCQNSQFGDTLSKTCVLQCPPGYFGERNSSLCVLTCPSPSFTNYLTSNCDGWCQQFAITSNRTCTPVCPENLSIMLSLKQCLDQCPTGYFSDTPSKNCTPKCTAQGMLADPLTNNCSEHCSNPQTYYEVASTGSCETSCPANLYKDQQAMKCVVICATPLLGDNTTHSCVTECPSGYFANLIVNQCVQSCPAGTFANTFTKKCDSSCSQNYLADSTTNSCVTQCPSGSFGNFTTYVCVSQCQEPYYADNTTNACVESCPANYYTYNVTRVCTAQCPGLYYADSTIQSCTTKCSANLFGYPETKQCVDKCLLDYYGNTINSLCEKSCPVGSFANPISKTCVAQCPTKYYADTANNSCVQTCSLNSYAYSVTNECLKACPSPYFSDDTTVSCTKNCSSGLFAENSQRKCVSLCPDNFYADSQINSCVQTCSPNSFSYYGTRQCVAQCPEGLYADNSTSSCVGSCPQNSYAYSVTRQCLDKCPEGTVLGSSSNICQQNCPDSQYLNQQTRQCVAQCPQGTFTDISTKTCTTLCSVNYFAVNSTQSCEQQCPANSFANNLKRVCVDKCYQPLFSDSQSAKCVETCPQLYYADAIASQCVEKCASPQYSDPSTMRCVDKCPVPLYSEQASASCVQKCSEGLLQDIARLECVSQCPSGYQADYTVGRCVIINTCLKTQFFYNNKCMDVCPNPYFGDSLQQTCVANCQPGYFADVMANRTCANTCTPPTFQLSTDNTCVQVCPSPFFMDKIAGKCVTSCPNNTFVWPNNTICQNCNQICATCNGPLATNCTTCAAGAFMNFSSVPSEQVCVLSCGATLYFGNQATGRCEQCESKCEKCLSLQQCLTCNSAYVMDNGQCLDSCPLGKVKDINTKTCIPCQVPCASCETNATRCVTCTTGYFMLSSSSQCVVSCPAGQYPDKQVQQCKACGPTCSTCFDSTKCTACAVGYLFSLTTGSCNLPPPGSTQCGTGQFYNKDQQKCQLCSDRITGCKQCSVPEGATLRCDDCGTGAFFSLSTQQCTNCNSVATNCDACTYVLNPDNNQQIFTCLCNFGFYYDPVQKSCLKCADKISGCIGQCYLNKNQLTCKDCGPGNYFDFTPTPTVCKACSDTMTGCLSCEKSPINNQVNCLYCGAGLYFDKTANVCSNCKNLFKGCLDCGVDQNLITATTTDPPLTCFKCLFDQYFNAAKMECEPCVQRQDLCQVCNTKISLGIEKFFCFTCLEGAYMDTTAQKCLTCETKILGCQRCGIVTLTGEFQCYSCQQGYAYVNTTALKTCKQLTSTQICDPNCDNCQLDLVTITCKKCKPGYMLKISEKSCIQIQNCLDGQYFSGDQCSLCINIDKNCIKCHISQEGQQICDTCDNDYAVQNNQCAFSPGSKSCPTGCTDCVYQSGIAKCSSCSANYLYDNVTQVCNLNCVHLGLDNCQKCSQTILDTTKGTTLSVCLVCNQNFILSPLNKCVQMQDCVDQNTQVVSYQGFNPKTQACELCSANCIGCKFDFSADQMKCLVCNVKYQLTNWGECQYVGDNLSTQVCPPGCKECQFDQIAGLQSCTSCLNPNNTKLTKDPINNNIQFCKVQCNLTINQFCAQCSIDFKDVDAKPICQKCNDGYTLDILNKCIQTQVCSSISSAIFFNPVSKICENCQPNCARCEWDNNLQFPLCRFPAQNYTLTQSGKCVLKANASQSSCPDSMFADFVNKECIKCPENCIKCEIDSYYKVMVCKICSSGYIYKDIKDGCVLSQTTTSDNGTTTTTSTGSQQTCLPGYYLPLASGSTTSAQQCDPCPFGCRACKPHPQVAQAAFCTSCINDVDWYLNQNGQCLQKNCKDGSYFDIEKGCQACPQLCAKCLISQLTGRVSCNTCFPDAQMDPTTSTCSFKQCQTGTTMVQSTCQKCPDFCQVCTYSITTLSITCIECQKSNATNYTNIDGICTVSCPEQQYYEYFGDQTSQVPGCRACPKGCSSCYYNTQKKIVACSACQLGYTLIEQSVCRDPQNIPAESEAPQCNSGEMLIKDISGQSTSFQCKACSFNCKTCYWNYQTAMEQCTECSNSTLYSLNTETQSCIPINQQQSCQPTKPQSPQFYNYATSQCESCPEGCKTCSMNFETSPPLVKCSSCNVVANYFLIDNSRCQLKCDDGQYAISRLQFNSTQSVLKQVCEKCPNFCSQCEFNQKALPLPKAVCLQCSSSNFYLKEGVCVVIPDCRQNEYLVILKKQKQSYADTDEPQCVACPTGCLNCKSKDMRDPLSGVVCGSCDSTKNLVLDSTGSCVPSLWMNKKTCLKGEYLMLVQNKDDSLLDSWECNKCPASCAGGCEAKAGSLPVCNQCNTNYYLTADGQCQALPTCEVGQYPAMNFNTKAFACQQCPEQCTECTAQINNEQQKNTIICVKCIANFVLNPTSGKCLMPVSSSSSQASTAQQSCLQGQYAFIVDGGFVKCQSCLKGCSQCFLEDPTKIYGKVLCKNCTTGYKLSNSQCILQCPSGSWPDTSSQTNSTAAKCVPCHWKCSQCKGIDENSCTVCVKGYILNELGLCIAETASTSTSQQQQQSCGNGIDAFYDEQSKLCSCNDQQKVFDITTKTCKTPSQAFSSCPIGQYYNATQKLQNRCAKCRVNGNRQTCAQCTGPQPANCIECNAGDFLNTTEKSCMQCSYGCEKCANKAVCTRCKIGFYIFAQEKQGQFTQTCSMQCPVGSIPAIASLYYLNKQLFTEDEIQQKLTVKPYNLINSSSISLAVGVSGEPIFENLPWQIVESTIPSYNGNKIRLECVACKDNCKQCVKGMLLIKDKLQCIWSQYCPDGYSKKTEKDQEICIKTVPSVTETIIIKNIEILSYAPEALLQPLDKQLIVRVNTNQDSSTQVQYEWNVTEIKEDVYGVQTDELVSQELIKQNDLSRDDFQAARAQFFMGSVSVIKRQINIPPENMRKDFAYLLEIKVTYKTNKPVYEKQWVHVRKIVSKRSIQSLGISPTMFSVSPNQGYSGNTTFKATYTLSSVKALGGGQSNTVQQQQKWKFTVEVGKDSIPLVSYKLNDFLEFVVPVNKAKDIIVQVKFTISKGEDYFETFKSVLALANPNFDLSTSALMTKILNNNNNNSSKLGKADLATGASMIKDQVANSQEACLAQIKLEGTVDLIKNGPCTTIEMNPCCGRGTCVSGQQATYKCICNEGFTGTFCTVPKESAQNMKKLLDSLFNQLDKEPITENSAQSIISAVKQIAKSQIVDQATIEKLLDKLQSATQYITDERTLNDILSAIGSVREAMLADIYSKNDTSLIQKQQQNAFKSTQTAVQNQAKNLNPSNPESVFNGGGIHGKSKLIEKNDENDSTNINDFAIELSSTQSSTSTTSSQSSTQPSVSNSIKVGISKQTLASNSEATSVSCIVAPKSHFNSMKNSSNIQSDSLEISVVGKSGQSLSLQGLSGECPVSFTLIVTESKIISSKKFSCQYMDQENLVYKSEGCFVASSNILRPDYAEVNCCCNHLTLFSIYSDDTTPVVQNTETNTNNTNNNGASNTNNNPTATVKGTLTLNRLSSPAFYLVVVLIIILSLLVQ